MVGQQKRFATITGVIAAFEDLRRLHRTASWDGMPERYGIQKRMLISVKAANPNLTDAQKSILQSEIHQLSTMERDIEQHLAAPAAAPDAARLNRTVSRQADSLTRLLTELKIEGGTS
jgi:hypothetical protein